MRTWIHFIGKQYYKSIDAFIEETQEYGINRAVAPAVFRKMEIGDNVLLAYKDGSSSKIFGYFVIERIAGLNDKLIASLEQSGHLQRDKGFNPVMIERECGEYEIINSYSITDPGKVKEAVNNVEKKEMGRTLIGGKFHSLDELDHRLTNDYVLSKIPFQKGFRLFNIDEFIRDFQNEKMRTAQGRHVKVKGQYYAKMDDIQKSKPYIADAKLFQIANYKLN